MTEEMILRLGWDAEKVRKGTLSMLDQQRKAAMDYVSFWKKAINEREQLEISADVRAAQRSNRARALLRQRHNERVEEFKRELSLQRAAAGVSAEAKNVRGVALDNLKRNVVAGAGHGFGANSTAMREMLVVLREAGRGNWSRIPGSISIIIQSMGKLGTVISALTSPITVAVGAIAAASVALYRIGQGAIATTRRAGEIGLSTGAYQTFIRQAGRESGGGDAANEALGTFGGNLAGLRMGDLGQLQKFRRYGVATSGAGGNPLSNEQILSNVLEKYNTINDPARRAAFAMDMFGDSYKKFVRTLEEGSDGFQKAMGKGIQSAQSLGVWSAIGNVASDVWGSTKQVGGAVWSGSKGILGGIISAFSPALRIAGQEAQRSQAIDAREQALIASGRIKPRHMTQAQFEQTNPELAANLKDATMRQQDLQNELADRGKLGLTDLAEMGRRLSGHIRPRQFTVTARMRTAMKIDDLEAAATRAWERGNDSQMLKLRGEADAMRKANPWLRFQDRNPTQKIEEQLVIANKALKDVQDMAKFVLNEK